MKIHCIHIKVQPQSIRWAALPIFFFACGDANKSDAPSTNSSNDITYETEISDTGIDTTMDTGSDDTSTEANCDPVFYDPNPFISEIVDVDFGEDAGFGQDQFPNIVFGPPLGGGENSGSLDVLTLGTNGSITVKFDTFIIDGVGPDFIVFENVFVGWYETGVVSASIDGITWYPWPCDPLDTENNFPGCAGVTPSLSHPDNCIDARDVTLAGGDAFDLNDIGLTEAQYIRITDSGVNPAGGFDLDAIAIVHGSDE